MKNHMLTAAEKAFLEICRIKESQCQRAFREDAKTRASLAAIAYMQDPDGDGGDSRDYFSEAANAEMGQD